MPVHAQVKAPDERRLLHAQLERWRLVGVTGMAGLTRWCDRQPPYPTPPRPPVALGQQLAMCYRLLWTQRLGLRPSSGGTRAVFVVPARAQCVGRPPCARGGE